jgi:hypothetical protein
MIELDKESFKIAKQYSPQPWKEIFLFGAKFTFHKHHSGEHLAWSTRSRYGSSDVDIHHRGRFTWHSMKKTLERYLNYHNSYLRRVIIMRQFK